MTFDLAIWAQLLGLVVRILRAGDQRLWVVAGRRGRRPGRTVLAELIQDPSR